MDSMCPDCGANVSTFEVHGRYCPSRHLIRVIEDEMTLHPSRERVRAWRASCSCGWMGGPVLREKIAQNEGKTHVRSETIVEPPHKRPQRCALCGAFYPLFHEGVDKVTCKRCGVVWERG